MLVSSKKIQLKKRESLILKSPTSENAQNLPNQIENVFNQSYQNLNRRKNNCDSFPIEKEFHNLGLGRSLLDYAVDVAKQNKIHRLELTFRTFNEAGISLYEIVGLRRIGILKKLHSLIVNSAMNTCMK
jgi:GNAT superfamily N-acetyltransferase